MKKSLKEMGKMPYLDEDILFLMLKLADYPFKKKREIRYEELRGQQDDAAFIKMMDAVLATRRSLGGLDILDLKINGYDFDKQQKERLRKFQEFLKWPEPLKPTGEVFNLENVFSFVNTPIDDARTVIAEGLATIIAAPRHCDFRIIVDESCQQKLFWTIETVAETFMENGFTSKKENFYTFANHRKHGFKIIREQVGAYGRELLLKRSDFDGNFRFGDFTVAMHKLKYLEILEIPITKENGFSFRVRVKEKLLDEEKKQESAYKKKQEIQPLKLPPRTGWEDIEIRFLNDYDIEIWAHGKSFAKADNEALGCVDTKSKDRNPDVQWDLLRKLSIADGKFDANHCKDIKERERFKQKKRTLSRRLKELFAIEDDPISYDSVSKSYTTKFKLQPDPELRGDGELHGIRDEY